MEPLSRRCTPPGALGLSRIGASAPKSALPARWPSLHLSARRVVGPDRRGGCCCARSPASAILVCFDPLSNCILLCVDSELLAVADQALQTVWSSNMAPAILGGSLGATGREREGEGREEIIRRKGRRREAETRARDHGDCIPYSCDGRACVRCAEGQHEQRPAGDERHQQHQQRVWSVLIVVLPRDFRGQPCCRPALVFYCSSGFHRLRFQVTAGGAAAAKGAGRAVFKLLPVVSVLTRVLEHLVLHENLQMAQARTMWCLQCRWQVRWRRIERRRTSRLRGGVGRAARGAGAQEGEGTAQARRDGCRCNQQRPKQHCCLPTREHEGRRNGCSSWAS